MFVARPAYVLAMKGAAFRLGEEFHDLDDVRYLNVSTADEAVGIVFRYFDEQHILPKTRLALEELLPGPGPRGSTPGPTPDPSSQEPAAC